MLHPYLSSRINLKKSANPEKGTAPKHFSYNPRKLNIILTQFRCSATFLNNDLFRINIVSDPSCRCGAQQEDSCHYFFECPLYNDYRHILFNSLNWVPIDCQLDLDLLHSNR